MYSCRYLYVIHGLYSENVYKDVSRVDTMIELTLVCPGFFTAIKDVGHTTFLHV